VVEFVSGWEKRSGGGGGGVDSKFGEIGKDPKLFFFFFNGPVFHFNASNISLLLLSLESF
jgi:hypothetical protein